MPTYTFHIYRLPDFVSRPPVNSSSSSTTSITGSSVTPIAIEVTDDDTGLTYNDSNQIITNSSDPNLIGLRITWSTSAMTNSVSPTHPNGSNLFIKALTISSGGSTTGGENFALAWQNNQTNGATDVLRPNTVYNNIPGNTGTFRIPYSNINDPSITFGDGYVDGTEGSDIIDVAYTGDPDGDRIDANDAILAGEAPNDDIVDARGGDDRVSAGLGNDDVYAGGGNDTVFGGSGADLIFGDSNRPGTTPSNGSGNDVLNGEAGNDTILGQGGNELLGGQGNDEIVGGSGDDSIDGGIGDDTIEGGEGSDTVQGGAGDDVIDSSNGLTPSDTLAPDIGYPGIFDADTDPFNDRDSVDGGAGNDTIFTGDDQDTITGGDGNDVIDAGIDDDSVDGGAGDDRIVGGEGNDTIDAGAGDDTIFSGNDPLVVPDGLDIEDDGTNPLGPDLAPDNGIDSVRGGAGNDVIFGADDDDRLFGDDGDDVIDGQIDDDFIDGGAGDDELLGGQGNDEIVGGSGDDSIDGGIGDDTIEGGEGSDTVQGGAGDDVIDSSNGLTPSDTLAPDIGYPGIFDADTDPFNDRDSVDGGAGNDTIFTGDDRDTITGGDGDDVIDAGIDDDSVDGGAGDDRIVGGEGNDTIDAGAGDDTIFSGNDPLVVPDGLDIEDDGTNPLGPDLAPDNGIDSVRGGAGNDVIFGADDDDRLFGDDGDDVIDGQIDDDFIDGGAGDDELLGGQGNDEIVGGSGDDSIDGGIGDDTIEGGIGNDNLSGGDDRDTFENVNAGDVVDGNEGGDDFDTLDLRGSAPAGGSLNIVFDPSNIENGEVFYFDDNGDPAGSLVFTNIEAVIPCFTPGTRIATPRGEIKVEALQVGDRVITRDRGIQEIRWVGQRALTGAELAMAKHLRPVLIRQGALGNDLPERDMMVSPNHRVLMANNETALYFEDSEVLVAAKHLTGLDGVDIVDASCVTYIHLMFDQHEVVLSDGAWTESFQPGDQTLGAMGDAQRNEIFELFPELSTPEGVEAYGSARRALKKHEAKLLIQ